jgi:hypothetical protein
MLYNDNFLDEEYIKKLQNVFYEDPDSFFPWIIGNRNFKSGAFMLTHKAIIDKTIVSPLSDESKKILSNFCYEKMIKLEDIVDSEAQLYIFGTDSLEVSLEKYAPKEDQFLFLYFVNQSNSNLKITSDSSTNKEILSSKSGRGAIIKNGDKVFLSSSSSNEFQAILLVLFTGHVPEFVLSDRVISN